MKRSPILPLNPREGCLLLHTLFISLFLLAGVDGTAIAGAVTPTAPTSVAATNSPADSTGPAQGTVEQVLDRADSLVAKRGGEHAENARLYLTWDAPFGMPRASKSHVPRAHDPAGVDTLWMSFLPGRTSEGFLAFDANLYFRAAQGDTLGAWWHMEGTGENKGALRVEFGPDATFPQREPWEVGGMGMVKLYRTPASAMLLVTFAVPYTYAVPINPDSVYTLCRVVINHRRVLPGCSQPVCVEWAKSRLSYWLKDEPLVNLGERFVSYASTESVCDAFLPIIVKTPEPDSVARPAHSRPRKTSRKPGR